MTDVRTRFGNSPVLAELATESAGAVESLQLACRQALFASVAHCAAGLSRRGQDDDVAVRIRLQEAIQHWCSGTPISASSKDNAH